MKKLIALVIVVGMMAAGCTGSFELTKKVYNFHRDQEGKWTDELIFLGCVILPVYSLATLGDAIIFNTIEFWTEENPLNKAEAPTKTIIGKGEDKVVMSYGSDGSVAIDSFKTEAHDASLVLSRTDDGIVVSDAEGNTLYTSCSDENGISVYDADGTLVKRFSHQQMRIAKRQFLR